MTTENEVSITRREDNTVTEENGIITILYSPEVCLLSKEPSAVMIAGMAFSIFRSEEDLKMIERIKIGDQINIKVDFSDPLCAAAYKAWNPPPEYKVEEGIYPMIATFVSPDQSSFPIIIGSPVKE